jgi:hypothetical protein
MWQAITFTPPETAATIHAAATGVTDAAPGELTGSAGRLAAVSGSVAMTTNPLAAAAALCAGLRDQLEALLDAGGKFVCIHPYLHPVGDRRGDYTYLTPADAVAALAAKLADPTDPAPAGGSLEAVVMMIRATTHADFQASLAAFNTVLPLTGLQLALRRAGWLAGLETEKLIQTVGPRVPAWHDGDLHRHSLVAQMDRALGSLVAMVEGYAAENTRPEDELAGLIAEKTQRLADLTSAWNTLVDRLQGDAGLGIYVAGDAGSIRRQLLASDPPAATWKLTSLACWIAPADRLTLLKETFGL